MAAPRYTHEHKAFYGTRYTTEIWDADYSGDALEFVMEGDTGFLESMLGKGRDRMSPVAGGELSFQMKMTSPDHESFITDLQNSREGRFTVRVYNTLTDRLAYAGVVLSDGTTYPDAAPYSIDVATTDGLAALKDVKYNNDGEPYVGVVSLVEHVLNCLNKLDYVATHYGTGDQLLAVSVDWYEATMPDGPDDDPLYQAGVDHAVFYKFDGNGQDYYSCYEVLENIMRTFGGRIFRQDKSFMIDQLTYRTGTMRVRRYTRTGTVLLTDVLGGSNDIDQTSEGALEATGQYGFFPALSAVKVTFSAKERRNYIAGWGAGTPFSLQAASINAVEGKSIMRFSATLTAYIANASLTEWEQNPLYIEFHITLKVGGKWAKRTYQMQNFQIQYSDITWESSSNTISYVVPCNFPPPGNGSSNQYNIDVVTPTLEGGGAYEFDMVFERVHNKNGTTITITNLPSPIPKANVSAGYTNAWLELFTFGFSAQYADELEYEATNDEATNTATIEIKTLLGDSDNPNTVGRLQVRDGAGGWQDSTYWGDGTNPRDTRIGHLLARLVLAGQTVPVRKMNASFFGSAIDIRKKYSWGGAEWVALGYERESGSDTVRGEFVELKYAPDSVSVTPVKLIIHQSPSTSLPNSPAAGGNTSGLLGLPPNGMQIPPATVMGPISDNYTDALIAPGSITTVDVTDALVAGEYQIGDEITLMNPVTGQGETLAVTAASASGDTSIAVTGTLTGSYPDGSYIIRRDVRIPSGLQGQILRKGAVKWEGYGSAAITDGHLLAWTLALGWHAAAPPYTGTVTSVALSAPSSVFNVSGSPVTGSGTLALALATQLANLVWAGPTSGGSATPAFRALVAADIADNLLPLAKLAQIAGLSVLLRAANSTGNVAALAATAALQYLRVNSAGTSLEWGTLPTIPSGTVTSVALSMPAVFGVSGSPITSSGTLTVALATQNANLLWAGPTTGAAAAPTFRALVAADIADNLLPLAKLAQIAGLSVLLRAANSTGNVAALAATAALQYLRVNSAGTSLEWGTLPAGPTGSGATGQIAYWTGASTQDGDVSFLYDVANLRMQINGTGSVVAPTAHYDLRIGTVSGNDPAMHLQGSISDNWTATLYNTRAGSAAANAVIVAKVGATTSGDAFFQAIVTGGKTWSFGVDNSDADKWKLRPQIDLATGTTGGEGLTITADVTPLVGINTDNPAHPLDVNGLARALTWTNRTDATGATHTFGTGAGGGASMTSLVCPNGNMMTVRFTAGTSPVAGARIINIVPPASVRHANKIYVTFSAANDQTALDIAKFSIDYSATTPANIALKSNALTTGLTAGGDYYLTLKISGHA